MFEKNHLSLSHNKIQFRINVNSMHRAPQLSIFIELFFCRMSIRRWLYEEQICGHIVVPGWVPTPGRNWKTVLLHAIELQPGPVPGWHIAQQNSAQIDTRKTRTSLDFSNCLTHFQTYEYGDAGAHILVPMFKLGRLLEEDAVCWFSEFLGIFPFFYSTNNELFPVWSSCSAQQIVQHGVNLLI